MTDIEKRMRLLELRVEQLEILVDPQAAMDARLDARIHDVDVTFAGPDDRGISFGFME